VGNPAIGTEVAQRVRRARRDERLEPLPESEAEVKAVAQLYGAARSRAYFREDASEDRFKSEAGKYDVLHLATHGVLDSASPMYSNIVLARASGTGAEDGLLEAWELMNLNLKAKLVVLSACETARGRIGAGEGVIGMMWALFVAGCPTTVVSQWRIDSAATRDLMVEFHRKISSTSAGFHAVSKSSALRQAALKLLKTNEYRHPFYWAGFIVVGDGS
jgi:CHAT domain-containing protein